MRDTPQPIPDEIKEKNIVVDASDEYGQEWAKALAEVGPDALKPRHDLTFAEVRTFEDVKPGQLSAEQIKELMSAKAVIVAGLKLGEKPGTNGDINPEQLQTVELSINIALEHLNTAYDAMAQNDEIDDVTPESLQTLKEGTEHFIENFIKYLHAEGNLTPESITRMIWFTRHADSLGMVDPYTPHTGLVRAFNDSFVFGHDCSDIQKMVVYVKEKVPQDKLEDTKSIEEVVHHKELAQLALLLVDSKIKPGEPITADIVKNPLRIHNSNFKLYKSTDGSVEMPLLPEEFVTNKNGAENAFFTSSLSSGAQILYAEKINDEIM
ncbi:MAG: hypothetical protein ABIH21_04910 [Patescibacteria group bacterium]